MLLIRTERRKRDPDSKSQPLGLILLAAFLLSAIAQVLYVRSAESTSELPPARPMTYEDLLESSAALADGIVIGYFLGMANRPDFPGIQLEVSLGGLEWLKGTSSENIIGVKYAPMRFTGRDPFAEAKPESTRYLLFMRRNPRLPPGKTVTAYGDASVNWEWTLTPSQYFLDQGVLKLPDSDSNEEQAIRRTLAAQSVESLARRSDLIVYGGWTALWRERTSGDDRVICLLFAVKQSINSGEAPDTVCAYRLVPEAHDYQRSILFLEQRPNGSYEVLGAGTGELGVDEGRVKATGEEVSTLWEKLKRWYQGR